MYYYMIVNHLVDRRDIVSLPSAHIQVASFTREGSHNKSLLCVLAATIIPT